MENISFKQTPGEEHLAKYNEAIKWSGPRDTSSNEFVRIPANSNKIMTFDPDRFGLATSHFDGKEVVRMRFVVTDTDDNKEKMFDAGKNLTGQIIRYMKEGWVNLKIERVGSGKEDTRYFVTPNMTTNTT